jgi:hypothetical protein
MLNFFVNTWVVAILIGTVLITLAHILDDVRTV